MCQFLVPADFEIFPFMRRVSCINRDSTVLSQKGVLLYFSCIPFADESQVAGTESSSLLALVMVSFFIPNEFFMF